ncbi:MAG: hypothetical protein WBD81_02945 [Collimonas pratensis]|uniref:hypothetical protein n=1 Tax=Collimonas pratensis TaxID=279113 RepID=UPI003C7461F6
MANSLHVPLAYLPKNLPQLQNEIANVFVEFGEMPPITEFEKKNNHEESLLKNFIMVNGESEEMQCWISFNECPEEISERAGYNYIAVIQTRRNVNFAGIVAYGLCKSAGYIVFNDSGFFDGQESYTAESLKTILKLKLIHK